MIDPELSACRPFPLDPSGLNPHAVLPYGLTSDDVLLAMEDYLQFLGFIDYALHENGIRRLATLMQSANFSTMCSEFMHLALAKHTTNLVKNRYHNGHPDLIPKGMFADNRVQHSSEGLEVKASRNESGWQGHNAEKTWLMVFVYDSNDAEEYADEKVAPLARPFRFKAVYAAQLNQDDWSEAPRKPGSGRTPTASVLAPGFNKMINNWIYEDPAWVAARGSRPKIKTETRARNQQEKRRINRQAEAGPA